MVRGVFRGLAAVAVLGALSLWLNNSSLLTSDPGQPPRFIAHRGVHQTYGVDGVENDTCTASLIAPPRHGFLENTVASMRAAHDAGAEVVELDVHLTPDRKFAVFHDWRLECRTNGEGVTEETPLAVLKSLDIGFGYTADGGKTFPFRRAAIGLMPSLDDVFRGLPDQRFLVNFKSRRVEEGAALAKLLADNPQYRASVWGVYGGEEPTREALRLLPGLRGFDPASVRACLKSYALWGWTGRVPLACRGTIVVVPRNIGAYLWGWPNLFVRRMQQAGSEVVLVGPYDGGGFMSGIDTVPALDDVPLAFHGLIWTNRIEVLGPAAKQRKMRPWGYATPSTTP